MNLTKKSPLSDVLLAYSAKKEVTAQTAKAYTVTLRVLTAVTGLRTVADLDKAKPGKVQDAFDAAIEQEKYSRKTLAMALVLGKGLRNFLRLRELVKENPFDAVQVRVGNNVPEHNVLQPGEVEKVLQFLIPGQLQLRYILLWRAVFLMLVRHGLRVSELTKLRLSDVSTTADGTRVMTWRGKGAKLARMAVQPDAWDAVEKWRRFLERKGHADSTAVVPSGPWGSPLSRGTVAHHIGWISEQALGHRVTPHGLRATFISTIISKKGIEHARKLARHSSLTTTQRYSRWEVLDVDE